MKINWNFSWEYEVFNFLGICPFGILLFPFGWTWYGVAIQIAGIIGAQVFSARDLARMDRECMAERARWAGQTK